MSTSLFESTATGKSVVLSETHVEYLQLVGRVGRSVFLAGGTEVDGGMTSGPNPYDFLAAALAACTVMTVRFYADRKGLPVRHISASVAFRRGVDGAPDVFERTLTIEADDLDPESEARLRHIAEICPVARTLAHAAEIRFVPSREPQEVQSLSSDYMRHVEELPIPNIDW